MLLPKEIAKLKIIVNRLVEAEINDTWKGAGDPDDIDNIEKELLLARAAFNKFLEKVGSV